MSDKNTLAIIWWRSLLTNEVGHGEPVSLVIAEDTCREMNDKYWGRITHWVEVLTDDKGYDNG